ncbi:hypothetical protein IMY05_010G0144700 [Salix suchowensis]|nr:hypothetical protein IMY05_010G0144700 [Salix suchowensis]
MWLLSWRRKLTWNFCTSEGFLLKKGNVQMMLFLRWKELEVGPGVWPIAGFAAPIDAEGCGH